MNLYQQAEQRLFCSHFLISRQLISININFKLREMYISNTKYRLAELSKNNLQASAKMLAESFLSQNQVWATLNPTLEELTDFMKAKAKEALEWQLELKVRGVIEKDTFLSFVYLDEEEQIAGVWLNCDLTHYLQKVSRVFLPQYAILQTYGQELEKRIERFDKVQGKSIYSVFSAMRPELMGTGAVMYFWLDMSHYLHGKGFKVIYARCSNFKSYKLVLKAGGYLLSKLRAIENGQVIILSLLKWKISPVQSQNIYSLTKPIPML